ncbi:response regulator transcription factor [Microbacterium sp. H1-D42]|uniref:response regulator transcription factor n=1 Tax=Microbacterium sp. H1-D42 TaxID=2925844 RepID=UPI001F532145|nr:response regulator transcription factor [Microbacterium sp. H1-D42]UNK70213.1 response regulator transcription factor [Microbacterium sp. H1-D42]
MVIRVAVIDGHPTMLLGVTALFNAQPDMRTVAAVSTARELLHKRRAVDVVLLALSLADGSTPAMNLRVLSAIDAPVLAFTAGDRPQLIREAAYAGAAGMIRKSEPVDAVVQTVRLAAQGALRPSAEWASALASDAELPLAVLTAREKQVLMLYASGETAESVAGMLFVSVETVIDHIRRIRGKYAAAARPASTKVDLYRRAQEDGLLPA